MNNAASSFDRDLPPVPKRYPDLKKEEQRHMPRGTVSSLFSGCVNAAKTRVRFSSGYDLGRAITRLYPKRDFRKLLFQSRLLITMTTAKEERSTPADIALFEQLSNPDLYGCCTVEPERIGPALKRLGVDERALRSGLYWGTKSKWDDMPLEKAS